MSQHFSKNSKNYRRAGLALLLCAASGVAMAESAGSTAGKAAFNLGTDATGRVCTARRLYGDPLLVNGRRDFAYDVSCGRAGSVGRVYLLGSRAKDDSLRAWRDAVAPLCIGPRPQEWAPEGLQAELGMFCAGGVSVGTRPATVLLAASHGKGLVAGDAPPASAPVIEFAMRVLAGVTAEPARARARGSRGRRCRRVGGDKRPGAIRCRPGDGGGVPRRGRRGCDRS